MGKRVIATNYSAHTEFCNEMNTNLIEIDKTEVAKDGKWFHGDGEWAALGDSQIEAMVEALRFYYKAWSQGGKVLQNTFGIETAKKFTWENTAHRIIASLWGA